MRKFKKEKEKEKKKEKKGEVKRGGGEVRKREVKETSWRL